MGKRSKTAQKAFDIAEPLVTGLGLDLVDVSYAKEGGKMFLRLYVDKKGGVGIDDCEAVSKATDPVLEKELGLDYDYFEVSSPGLTRPLETVSDYLRYMGETLDVSLYAPIDGIKEFSCVCEAAEEDKVKLKASDGREYELALSDIAKAVRHIEF